MTSSWHLVMILWLNSQQNRFFCDASKCVRSLIGASDSRPIYKNILMPYASHLIHSHRPTMKVGNHTMDLLAELIFTMSWINILPDDDNWLMMMMMSWSHVRLCQPAFLLLSNPMAYLGQMARDLMVCLWSHGRKVNLFVGMWWSSAHWPTLTCSLQTPPPVLLPSWLPPARSWTTAQWKTSTSSSPLLWSLLAPWTVMPASSWPTLVGGFIACLEMTGKPLFLFQRISVSLFRFNSVLLHNSFELDDRSEH